MDIAILLYDRVTALDAIGPYEVLCRMPGADVHFVGARSGEHRTDKGLGLYADRSIDDLPAPDMLLIPGSSDPSAALGDPVTLAWIAAAHQTADWTTSVCTGSLILGAAGVLRGRRATTHWAALDQLAQFGATAVAARIVTDGSIVTAAGVSAGIDLALRIAAMLHGDRVAQALQLAIEYDPEPPADMATLAASADVRTIALSLINGS